MSLLQEEVNMRVLVTGATGFIGSRLIPELLAKGISVRALTRNAARYGAAADVEVVQGDVLDRASLSAALKGVDAAYYFVHSMSKDARGTGLSFEERDRIGAQNFVDAAGEQSVQRIVYLGGLGDENDALSKHLLSRMEVGRVLASGAPALTTLRAALIIGAGGSSFEMLRYLTDRLPMMIAPKWLETRSQPIAVRDCLKYLAGCLFEDRTSERAFDIGGPDIVTYRQLIGIYAQLRGLKRFIIGVPVLTPRLSSYWINLVTPVSAELARPLVDGLKNEMICHDQTILDLISFERTPIREAIRLALLEPRPRTIRA
jgi:uncharacterized protein YbjT (DUF2867 family)